MRVFVKNRYTGHVLYEVESVAAAKEMIEESDVNDELIILIIDEDGGIV